MQRPEYHALPRSPEPAQNLRATVKFSHGGMVAQREFPFAAFLAVLDASRMEMDFDEWPHRITRFDVDFDKRTLKIFVSPV